MPWLQNEIDISYFENSVYFWEFRLPITVAVMYSNNKIFCFRLIFFIEDWENFDSRTKRKFDSRTKRKFDSREFQTAPRKRISIKSCESDSATSKYKILSLIAFTTELLQEEYSIHRFSDWSESGRWVSILPLFHCFNFVVRNMRILFVLYGGHTMWRYSVLANFLDGTLVIWIKDGRHFSYLAVTVKHNLC